MFCFSVLLSESQVLTIHLGVNFLSCPLFKVRIFPGKSVSLDFDIRSKSLKCLRIFSFLDRSGRKLSDSRPRDRVLSLSGYLGVS